MALFKKKKTFRGYPLSRANVSDRLYEKKVDPFSQLFA